MRRIFEDSSHLNKVMHVCITNSGYFVGLPHLINGHFRKIHAMFQVGSLLAMKFNLLLKCVTGKMLYTPWELILSLEIGPFACEFLVCLAMLGH